MQQYAYIQTHIHSLICCCSAPMRSMRSQHVAMKSFTRANSNRLMLLFWCFAMIIVMPYSVIHFLWFFLATPANWLLNFLSRSLSLTLPISHALQPIALALVLFATYTVFFVVCCCWYCRGWPLHLINVSHKRRNENRANARHISRHLQNPLRPFIIMIFHYYCCCSFCCCNINIGNWL